MIAVREEAETVPRKPVIIPVTETSAAFQIELGRASSASQSLFTRRGYRASDTVSIGEPLCVCQ